MSVTGSLAATQQAYYNALPPTLSACTLTDASHISCTLAPLFAGSLVNFTVTVNGLSAGANSVLYKVPGLYSSVKTLAQVTAPYGLCTQANELYVLPSGADTAIVKVNTVSGASSVVAGGLFG